MRAPGYLRFDLKPQYDRFVALAGVDDNMLDHELGRNIALHPSMIFKVFIDGRLAAESPVMRISQEPWRFDVQLPSGSRQIVLASRRPARAVSAQLGNWVRGIRQESPSTVIVAFRSAKVGALLSRSESRLIQ